MFPKEIFFNHTITILIKIGAEITELTKFTQNFLTEIFITELKFFFGSIRRDFCRTQTNRPEKSKLTERTASLILEERECFHTDNGERSQERDEWHINERGLETILTKMFCGGVARDARDAGDDKTRNHHISHGDQNGQRRS